MNKDLAPGLYVHVPFCSGKCPYCDFYSVASSVSIPAWLEGIAREIELYRGAVGPIETLYIGGGTPSRLTDGDLAVLLKTLTIRFRLVPDAEVTLEANPEDVTVDRMKRILALGVNRVSLGVQSFDERELEFLQRRHTALQAVGAAEAARRAGCLNLSLDLIYGLPDQSEAHWIDTLKRALDFEPEHLSCYELTVEKGTMFGRLRDSGKLKLPDEDVSRSLFLATSRFLEDHGYVHYEVSNFARGRGYRCRHNMKYWHHAPYIGLGPAAHSFKDGVRWWNLKSIRGYCDALEAGRRPVDGEETLSREQIALEAIFLGLRTKDGVDIDLVRADSECRSELDRLRSEGLASVIDGRLVLTREGLLFADHIALLLTRIPEGI